MSKGNGYKPGPHSFLISIDDELNLDLHAFCQLHYYAPKQEVVRQALRRFIDEEVGRRDEQHEFRAVRSQLKGESGQPLHLIKGTQSVGGAEE